MTETVKTLIYAGTAILLLVVAVWVSLPPSEDTGLSTAQELYPEFDEPRDATRLEIVRVNEERGKLERFEVQRSREGGWVIPSHGNYPADATAQMSEAATSLIDLNIIGVASEVADEHELYGVVEPTEARLDAGDKGFGMLVAFQNRKGDDLARLVVGKKVANTENQRFVRKAGQDVVYVVDLNIDKLTTNFSDWIEKDLLKISPWDIDQVTIKDYQFIARPSQGSFEFELDPRMELTAGLDSDSNSWTVDKLIQYARRRPVETELRADEELNKEKLDELKSALDNLQIVDVQPKPKGLAGDLSADEAAFNNPELLQSLQSLGFIPREQGGKPEFLGLNGELNVGTKDGVEYVLRFGNSAGSEEGTTESGEAKVRRYIFVTARVDHDRLQPPVLEELPEEATVPTVGEASETESDAASSADEKDADEKDAADEPDAEAATEDDAQADGAENKQDDKPSPPATSDLDLKRKQIEKENQRKLDEFNERKRKAEAKVRELNARFADWYYVISDDEYQKIHLTRNEVIQERTGPGAETFGVDAFRELEQQGPLKPAPVPQPPAGGPHGGLPPGLNFGQ